MDTTVISDVVNVASRLEGLTKHYGVPVLMSGDVVTGLPAALAADCRYVDRVRVQGRTTWRGVDGRRRRRANRPMKGGGNMKKVILAYSLSVLFVLFGFSQAKQTPQKIPDQGKSGISLDEVSRMLIGKWQGTHEASKITIWFYAKDRLLVSYEADEYKAGKYKIAKGKEYFVFELIFGDDFSKAVFDVIDEKHIVIDFNGSVDPDVTSIDTCLLLEKE